MVRFLGLGIALACLLVTQAAQAKSHLWKFTEVFSTADGTVQFIEMTIDDPAGTAEWLIENQLLESNANLYVFPNNLPFINSYLRSILIATPAFAALPGAPTPDFLMPPNFFDPVADVLNYRNASDVITLPSGAVPVDGILSYLRNGSTSVNSPTNFAGDVGSVDASMPCDDGLDNDGDGFCDTATATCLDGSTPGDPGCASPTDPDGSERSASLPCDDGLDNDSDLRRDFDPVTKADTPTFAAGLGDPACFSPFGLREDSQCQDGLNNDPIAEPDPGMIDFDGGASLDLDLDGFIDAQFNAATPAITAPDPQCSGPERPWKNKEKVGCGLGFELAFLLLPILGLRRRRAGRVG